MILFRVISCFYEVVSTFLRCDGSEDLSGSIADGIGGAARGFAQQVFELGEELFDGVQVGGVFWQEEQLGAG